VHLQFNGTKTLKKKINKSSGVKKNIRVAPEPTLKI
jgi:hypothetical protein